MIERSDVGAWVIKGDPKVWDYFAALADDTRAADARGLFDGNWTISNNYRKDLMEPGDRMVLWITGSKRPGIYEAGRLTTHAAPGQGFDLQYALDMQTARAANHYVEYRAARLDQYLPRSVLKMHPVLGHCEQIRAPQGANPSYLTDAEAQELRLLLAGHGKKGPLKVAGWA